MLGYTAVVLRAHQAQVDRSVVATHPEGVAMVELQGVVFGTAPAVLIDEAAAQLVPLGGHHEAWRARPGIAWRHGRP
jgi:hypothetical protein